MVVTVSKSPEMAAQLEGLPSGGSFPRACRPEGAEAHAGLGPGVRATVQQQLHHLGCWLLVRHLALPVESRMVQWSIPVHILQVDQKHLEALTKRMLLTSDAFLSFSRRYSSISRFPDRFAAVRMTCVTIFC